MHILIVDDSRTYRSVAGHLVKSKLPEATVTEYDPLSEGKPSPDFNWGEFDLLLLDYNLGGEESGFNWLQEFGASDDFPPTIILTGEGDEYIAVKAIKLGASDYLNKTDLTPQRLYESINDAIQNTREKIAAQEREKLIVETRVNAARKSEDKARDIPYRFVRLIGEGASSKVYLAERESDKLTVVMKIMEVDSGTDDTAIKRFMLEAELLSKMDSPFIVRTYDYGLTNDFSYIAMEMFTRGDLRQRMELNLTKQVSLSYLTHIVSGLRDIHAMGILHRDIKPANIMFRGDDSLAIADFGISKNMESTFQITTLGQILGTPHYISPEQARGGVVDQRSDLYSAGIILYELVAGEKPYNANSAAALIYQHIHATVPTLPSHVAVFQNAVNKSLAKDPDDRFQSADEFLTELEKIEAEIY